ncbi:hypothetical protein ACTFIW_001551 [Dictyostelium discoideum]
MNNKELKNFNNENQNIFWKVIHNKVLFNLIFYFIENDETINQNHLFYQHFITNNLDYSDLRIKFKNLKNLNWFVEKNEYSLLLDKLKHNQYINVTTESLKLFLSKCNDIKIIDLVYKYLNDKNLLPFQNLAEESILNGNKISFEYFYNYNDNKFISIINPTTILYLYEICSDIEIIKCLINNLKKRNQFKLIYNDFVRKKAISCSYLNKNLQKNILLQFILSNEEFYFIPPQLIQPSDIIQSNTPIILPSHLTIPQLNNNSNNNNNIINNNKIPFVYYKDCNYETRKKILQLNLVEKKVIYNSSKFEIKLNGKNQDEEIDELKTSIHEFFQIFGKKYFQTPIHILKRIELCNNDGGGVGSGGGGGGSYSKSNQIKELMEILLIECQFDFNLFIIYYQRFNDTKVLDKTDSIINNKFLLYLFQTMDSNGLLYFTNNHISVTLNERNSYIASSNSITSGGDGDGGGDGNNLIIKIFNQNYPIFQIKLLESLLETSDGRDRIIEFIKFCNNQDLIKIEIWDTLIRYLLYSNKCDCKFLDKIISIDGFNKKLVLLKLKKLSNRIRPFEKYKWYIESVKRFIKPLEYFEYNSFWERNEIESIEHVDYIFENKLSSFYTQQVLNETNNKLISINFKILDINTANHFHNKFPLLSKEQIYTDCYINALVNCTDLKTMDLINNLQVNIKSTQSNYNFNSKLEDSIQLLQYLCNYCNNSLSWQPDFFFNFFYSLLNFIFKNDNSNNITQQLLKEISFNNFYFENYNCEMILLLSTFILELNLQQVKFLISSFNFNFNYQQQIQSINIFKKFSNQQQDHHHHHTNDFKCIIEMINYLLDNVVPSSSSSSSFSQIILFDEIFNHLFKRLLISSDISFNEILTIKSFLISNGINLIDDTPFHLFNYLLIKSPYFLKYILKSHPEGIELGEHISIQKIMTSELFKPVNSNNDNNSNNYVENQSFIFNSKFFTLDSIIKSSFNQLFQLLSSLYYSNWLSRGLDRNNFDFQFILSIGKFDLMSEMLLKKQFKPFPIMIPQILKLQDTKLIKLYITSLIEYYQTNDNNNNNYNLHVYRLLLEAIKTSNLSITQLILENFNEFNLDIETLDKKIKDTIYLFEKTDSQLITYIFKHHLHLFKFNNNNNTSYKKIFEQFFINGSIEVTQLFFEMFPPQSSKDLEITKDMISIALNRKNINIIKYFYQNGKISKIPLINHIKESLKNELDLIDWLK